MSLKQAVAKLDAGVMTLSEGERVATLAAADRVVRGMMDALGDLKQSIPEARLAEFGKLITDVVAAAFGTYVIAHLSPFAKRPAAETVGVELGKALEPARALAELMRPIAVNLQAA